MNPLISVITSIYNAPMEYIKPAIESILTQTYRELEYVVIIDNPDRNDVIEWIDSIDDKRIKLYINKKNLGLQKSLNIALGHCKGEYIARMDDDDISLPDRLACELHYIEKTGCDIVGTNVIQIDEYGKVYGQSHLLTEEHRLKDKIKYGGGIPHPTWMVKRGVYSALEGYREIELAEDYDFLVRAYMAGYRFGLVENPLVQYRQSISGISQTNKGRQKVVAEIVREQIANNKLYSVQEINEKIRLNARKIEQYTQYYAFTRSWRNRIDGKCSVKTLELNDFHFYYVVILIRDFCRNIVINYLVI